jgi:hypothetical protein
MLKRSVILPRLARILEMVVPVSTVGAMPVPSVIRNRFQGNITRWM